MSPTYWKRFGVLLALVLLPSGLRAQFVDLPTYPCLPVALGNLTYSHPKEGYGLLFMRFIGPHKRMTPPSPLAIPVEYWPKSIEVTGPGSRPWVASGNWLGHCHLIQTFVIAKVDAFLGDAWQLGEEGPCAEGETEEEQNVDDSEILAPEDGESSASSTSPRHNAAQDPIDECSQEWPDSPPPNGGGHGEDLPPPLPDDEESGTGGGIDTLVVCTEVEWTLVLESGEEILAFISTYCEVYYL